MKSKPRQYSFIKFDFENIDQASIQPQFKDYTRIFGTPETPKIFIFFGKIPNKPGYCIILDHEKDKFVCFWQTDYFIEIET